MTKTVLWRISILEVNKNTSASNSLSTVGRLRYPGNEEALSIGWTGPSSSLSLVTERGLRALLADVGTLHALESDALELLCTLSLTLGTSSLPSIPRGRRARSRLGGECAMDWVEVGEVGVGVARWREARESDRRWNDWENFAIISSDEERWEGGAGGFESAEEDEARGAR